MKMNFFPSSGWVSENHIEKFLSENIELVEEGMKLVGNQINTGRRYVDILAIDRNGKMCAVEIKLGRDKKRLPNQVRDYDKTLGGLGRVIVIAPCFFKADLQQIKDIKSVEFKEIIINKSNVIVRSVDIETYDPTESDVIFSEVEPEEVKVESAAPEVPSKSIKIGNTTVVIHSPLVAMTEEERKQWFKDEWEKGNPVLKDIAEAVEACYRD